MELTHIDAEYYHKFQNILLLGEGDLSFALSLRQIVKSANQNVQVTASTFESREKLAEKYPAILEKISSHTSQPGLRILHGVDATQLTTSMVSHAKNPFDLVIFNFPHTGGKSFIHKNRELLSNFFKSLQSFLAHQTPSLSHSFHPLEVHVSLGRNQGGTPCDPNYSPDQNRADHWQIIERATEGGFLLSNIFSFPAELFSGYSPSGYRQTNRPFRCHDARIHVFRYGSSFHSSVNPLISAFSSSSSLSASDPSLPVLYWEKYLKEFKENLTSLPLHPALVTIKQKLIANSCSQPFSKTLFHSVVCEKHIQVADSFNTFQQSLPLPSDFECKPDSRLQIFEARVINSPLLRDQHHHSYPFLPLDWYTCFSRLPLPVVHFLCLQFSNSNSRFPGQEINSFISKLFSFTFPTLKFVAKPSSHSPSSCVSWISLVDNQEMPLAFSYQPSPCSIPFCCLVFFPLEFVSTCLFQILDPRWLGFPSSETHFDFSTYSFQPPTLFPASYVHDISFWTPHPFLRDCDPFHDPWLELIWIGASLQTHLVQSL